MCRMDLIFLLTYRPKSRETFRYPERSTKMFFRDFTSFKVKIHSKLVKTQKFRNLEKYGRSGGAGRVLIGVGARWVHWYSVNVI